MVVGHRISIFPLGDKNDAYAQYFSGQRLEKVEVPGEEGAQSGVNQ